MVKIKLIAEKKAISPIISMVLLLMMTVAVAAGAYTWFKVNQQRIQLTTETSVASVQTTMAVNLRILDLNSTRTGVIVQNIGSFDITSASVVVNGLLVNTTNISIPAGGIGIIPIGDNAVDENNKVAISLMGPQFGSAQKTFTITDNYQIEILNVTCSPCSLGSPGYCTVEIDSINYCSRNVSGTCTYINHTNSSTDCT